MVGIGTPLMWSLFAAFVLLALLVDFFALNKQGAHRVSMKEAAVWSLIWVAVSFVFVGDAAFAALRAQFTEQQIVDLVGVTGFYATVSLILYTVEAAIPTGEDPPLAPLTEPLR